jgi:hypothetical protein
MSFKAADVAVVVLRLDISAMFQLAQLAFETALPGTA